METGWSLGQTPLGGIFASGLPSSLHGDWKAKLSRSMLRHIGFVPPFQGRQWLFLSTLQFWLLMQIKGRLAN
jgi:hypothetical protein